MKKTLFVLLLVFNFSCKKEKEEVKINIDEVESLGIALQHEVEKDDIRAINELFDKESFAKLFLKKTTKKKIHEFNVGFFSGFARRFNFGELLIEQKSGGGSYEFIRAYQDENKDFRILFRLYNEGLNYHDYLIKKVNGEPKIIDMYIYMSGENLSDTYRTYYKNLLSSANILNNDTADFTLLKDVQKLDEIRSLNTSGNYKEAHDLYGTISNKSKRTKTFKLLNIMVSYSLSEEAYKEAIKDYEDKFPNDPSLYLISLDGLILNKEFDKSLANLNKLDEALGGDPFLHFIRGNIYYYKKDYDNALGKFAITNLEYPDFIDAYDSALGIYLETNNHKKVIEILDLYVNKFEIDKNELKISMEATAPNFIKTKDFKNWFSNN
jgi:tetratricopeptide (TPR) repeat protein